MNREEFESLTMKKGNRIPQGLYDSVEYFYMSDNAYHAQHGGTCEDKVSFAHRVFGGKVNTLRSIINKLTEEAIRENRWALLGNQTCNESRLSEMDRAIANHYRCMHGVAA